MEIYPWGWNRDCTLFLLAAEQISTKVEKNKYCCRIVTVDCCAYFFVSFSSPQHSALPSHHFNQYCYTVLRIGIISFVDHPTLLPSWKKHQSQPLLLLLLLLLLLPLQSQLLLLPTTKQQFNNSNSNSNNCCCAAAHTFVRRRY